MKQKDLNYIAALEKAIKKKYGEDAIQNPAKYWNEKKEKQYLQQLEDFYKKKDISNQELHYINVDGVLITHKLFNKEAVLNCPVCSKKVNTINDDIYIIKHRCCERCFIRYVEGREERWKSGWRPKNAKDE
jgi:hypothetical protein